MELFWIAKSAIMWGKAISRQILLLAYNKLTKKNGALLSNFKSNVRRNIRKAEKSMLAIDVSQSLESVKNFYILNCVTRQRHGLPPQPFSFFKNIHKHLLMNGYGKVISARFKGKTIASAIFLGFSDWVIYKYGASDSRYQQLRPNNLIHYVGSHKTIFE